MLLLLASCAEKRSEVGKYIYVDCFNVIHVDRDCPSTLATDAKTKDERLAARQGVDFVDTCDLINTVDSRYEFCPSCVDDRTYEHLERIMRRNHGRMIAPHTSALGL